MTATETSPIGKSNFIQKLNPDFTLVDTFRVSLTVFEIIATFTSVSTCIMLFVALYVVLERKLRHQSIFRPWFPPIPCSFR